MPPSSTAAVVASASRTKISTSQSRHFRIAYAKASGMSTSGTTERPREERRRETEDPREDREQQERREPDGDAEADPADLLLRLGVLAAAPEQESQPPDRGGREEPEVHLPDARRELQRGGGVRAGREERRFLEGEIGGARQIQEGEQLAVPDGQRPREDQEEMEEEGGQRARGRSPPRAGRPSRFRRAVRPASPRRRRRTRGRGPRRAAPRGPLARDGEEADQRGRGIRRRRGRDTSGRARRAAARG